MSAALATVLAVGAFLGARGGSSSDPGAGASGSSPAAAAAQVAVGTQAPDGVFTTVDGQQMSVVDLRGQPTLLWFVATWCSSCQAGTQVVAQNIAQLRAHGVRVVEVELYDDLGQSGPSIAAFKTQLAGDAAQGRDWTFATSSQQLTTTYDPGAYLDIYYLLDRNGVVRYVNGSPAATWPDLLTQTEKLA